VSRLRPGQLLGPGDKFQELLAEAIHRWQVRAGVESTLEIMVVSKESENKK